MTGDGSSHEETLYEILEVGPTATHDEIEQAYRRIRGYLDPGSLALYSMDDPQAIDRQRAKVDLAYEVLCDPERRADYDREPSAVAYPNVVVPAPATASSSTLGHVEVEPGEPSTATSTEVPESAATAPDGSLPASVPEAGPTDSTATQHSSPVQPRISDDAPRILPTSARDFSRTARRLEFQAELPELSDDAEISGALFKSMRESVGASLREVAEITKIGRRYLRAIEENDFKSLPASVYVRGFVHEYARILGLPAAAVAKGYMKLYRRYEGDGGT